MVSGISPPAVIKFLGFYSWEVFLLKKNLRALILTAIFAALSIVLGKFAAINIGETIRISFESFPIMLTSFFFGPVYGLACGVVADVLGCVLRGYALIPLITVASALMGVIPAVMKRYLPVKNHTAKIMISGITAHVICSMLIKTVALDLVYKTGFFALLATRVPVYIVTAAVESYLCSVILSRKFVRREIMFKIDK